MKKKTRIALSLAVWLGTRAPLFAGFVPVENPLDRTGFEPEEGFEAGLLVPTFWATVPNAVSSPVISTASPFSGTQHLRLAHDTGLPTTEQVLAVRHFPDGLSNGPHRITFRMRGSHTGISNYSVFLLRNDIIVGGLTLFHTGDILGIDDINGDNFPDFAPTGRTWGAGPYHEISIQANATANAASYFFNSTHIYSSVGNLLAPGMFDTVAFLRTNEAGINYADIDEFQVVDLNSPGFPDLNLGFSEGWVDRLSVGIAPLTVNDDHTYDGPYFDDQVLYLNWGASNVSPHAAPPYTVRVAIDGGPGGILGWPFIPGTPNFPFVLTNDEPFGPLSAGTHRLQIWADYNDTAVEEFKSDNYYERTITVFPAGTDPDTPLVPVPFGLDEGVFRATAEGEFLVPGEQVSFSMDLEAGQRVSAMAHTPELGGVLFQEPFTLPIPNDGTPVEGTVEASGLDIISDLDVVIGIEHHEVGDLDIELVSPGGIVIPLSTGNGGDGNTYLLTVFDDEAPMAIDSPMTEPPFAGMHRPESPLSVLDGTPLSGTWRLRVTDTDPRGSEGQLAIVTLIANAGADTSLTISGPDGQLAANGAADDLFGDAGLSNIVIPTTGTYRFTVQTVYEAANEISIAARPGTFTLDVGVFDASVPGETGATTDLDPVRAAAGDVATVLGVGDGFGEEDDFTVTLEAGESLLAATSTPGSIYLSDIEVTGPGGFALLSVPGPETDSVIQFTAPQAGVYTITVFHPFDMPVVDALPGGTYVLTLVTTDRSGNDSPATAIPIYTFDYQLPFPLISDFGELEGNEALWIAELSTTDTVDVFSLGTLLAGEVIGLRAFQTPESTLRPRIELIDSSGNVLAADSALGNEPGDEVALIQAIIYEDGAYFLRVTNAEFMPIGGRNPQEYLVGFTRFGSIGFDDLPLPVPRVAHQGAQAELTFDTVPAANYEAQSSTDLMTWTPLPDGPHNTGVVIDADLHASGAEFYRVVLSPSAP